MSLRITEVTGSYEIDDLIRSAIKVCGSPHIDDYSQVIDDFESVLFNLPNIKVTRVMK